MFIFVWFVAGGIGHFALTDLFVSVTPSWTPFPRFVVLATGVAELAGAFALLWAPLRRVAGLALIAFAIFVTPVHVEMLMQSERYPKLGEGALWARLLFEPVLIWIVWFATLAGKSNPQTESRRDDRRIRRRRVCIGGLKPEREDSTLPRS